jgi:hypothetical protein
LHRVETHHAGDTKVGIGIQQPGGKFFNRGIVVEKVKDLQRLRDDICRISWAFSGSRAKVK